ncbi:MAG: rod shape-determining protein [bacterium]|nr:rod shape-determining protein [bacterium]
MFTRDIGIDLGTANTFVCIRGKGIIMREPSVVAYDVRNDAVRAVGTQAKEMIGRTPGSIVAVKPLKDGVIADLDVTAAMLKRIISVALRGSLFSRTRVMICVPAGITEVETRAVYDATKQAGATDIDFIEVPLAAAIGGGIDISGASGNMVVDIGGGTTEIAVISLGDIVTSQAIRAAGDHFDEAIINHIARNHNLVIGDRTAEQIKLDIGSVLPYQDEGSIEVKGRNVVDGLPKNITIVASEIREAIVDIATEIIDAIRSTFERTPPELAADILDKGIVLTGGGALLRGMGEYISNETGLEVRIAENPIDCVVKGIAKRLETNNTFDTYVFRRGKKYR